MAAKKNKQAPLQVKASVVVSVVMMMVQEFVEEKAITLKDTAGMFLDMMELFDYWREPDPTLSGEEIALLTSLAQKMSGMSKKGLEHHSDIQEALEAVLALSASPKLFEESLMEFLRDEVAGCPAVTEQDLSVVRNVISNLGWEKKAAQAKAKAKGKKAKGKPSAKPKKAKGKAGDTAVITEL